ncbi:MAG: cytotoxin [Ruminococcus sp.]|jgi:mRNA-degrading endonuclease YafQ of YafQ-DinJ toxin-antitoxin module|nr:cytotoxin [Ruminococcus sp.]
MRYTLIRTKQFEKSFKKLSKVEKALTISKLEIFSQTPLHPSLRAKHIQGTKNLFEASVNMDIRFVWRYDGDRIILMLDIGHHDILNNY